MKVTYIGHSGFLVETSSCSLLFDHYQGEIPRLREDKPLFVFVSHRHGDHFNPEIFSIKGPAIIHYIISRDVERHLKQYEGMESLHLVRRGESLSFPIPGEEDPLLIRTLPSTDLGVAFLLRISGKNLYHAGDLNWWVWPGESEQYNKNMTANFKKYTEELKGLSLFAAFLPLDPRQQEWYHKGFSYILENASVQYAFPMHFWKDYRVISRFLTSPEGAAFADWVVKIEREGQSFLCEEEQEKGEHKIVSGGL